MRQASNKAHKTKAVAYPVIDLIKKRWSPVIYDSRPVDKETLHLLFEAARWAPSCYNEQPWGFVLGIKGEPGYDQILSTLVAPNQEWAHQAPVLGISIAHLHFGKNQKPNRHAYHDVGLAMGQLILQAVEVGVAVHQMAGFSVEKARQVCQLQEGYDPVAAFAIGYPGEAEGAPEALQAREASVSSRKEQGEFLFKGSWGKSLPI